MNKYTARRIHSARRKGLTLIELVMVLIILAALAALIVPIVDNVRRTSDKATASAAIQQVVENVSLFRTLTSNYPNQFDSLMEDSDIFSALPESDKYAVATLSANEAAGLTKTGITVVMDHDLSDAYRGQPGNSGVVQRTLNADGSDVLVVVIDHDIVESIYPHGSALDADGDGHVDVAADGKIVINDLDGDTSTTDDQITAKLVVLGVGPSNTSIGKTMVSAPAYQAVDGLKQYNRFLAVFAVYDGPAKTKRAQLKGALDSTGDFLNQELNEITENNLE